MPLTAVATVQFTADVSLDTTKIRGTMSFTEVVELAQQAALQSVQAALDKAGIVTSASVQGVNFATTPDEPAADVAAARTDSIASVL